MSGELERARALRARLRASSAARRDAVAALDKTPTQPAERLYTADDVEEITGKFAELSADVAAAVVREAMRSNHDVQLPAPDALLDAPTEDAEVKEEERQLRKVAHWGKLGVAGVAALAGVASAVVAAGAALGWW